MSQSHSPLNEVDAQNTCNLSKHLCISGRVQGVGYRYSLRAQAQSLGVTGWCRNLPTGDVEAIIQGSSELLNELIAWCKTGPTHAHVSQVLVSEVVSSELTADLTTTFEIRS